MTEVIEEKIKSLIKKLVPVTTNISSDEEEKALKICDEYTSKVI